MTDPIDQAGNYDQPTPEQSSLIGRLLLWCLSNKLVILLAVLFVIVWGVVVAPFDWETSWLPRKPVPTDAIPDIGENQQIVFTRWMGRTPKDVEDQITYPLTQSLLGVPGIKTIRSNSMFGFSTIFVIFREDVEFYWGRSRILEKLNSLPGGTLPEGVRPALGPDATALGQIYWYTLEGRDPDGNPIGGWDLEELRTIQDWDVRFGLLGAGGVAEVASVGGYVREYQVDMDPDLMRHYEVTLGEVYKAIQKSNIDVGAKTIEINRVEYFIRGIGYIKGVGDVENSVIKTYRDVPIRIKDVAAVAVGPALRRGALDKDGAEAVGGVVVARYGDNPLAVIKNVKKKITEEIAPALDAKAVLDEPAAAAEYLRNYAAERGFEAYTGEALNLRAWLGYLQATPRADWPAWADIRDGAAEVDVGTAAREHLSGFAHEHGFRAYDGNDPDREAWLEFLRTTEREDWPAWATISKVTIVPFYDRTGLIHETLGTLNDALTQEILITFIVVILMVMHLRSSLLIGGMLPLAVLLCFVAMKTFGVDANIVALSGIAIAIGTIVDMGIVVCENILRHLDAAPPEVPRLKVIHRAASEVGGAVLTAVATTVVSFLPVFTMTAAEGKLFKPLAFTKTFALIGSIVIALTILPAAAHVLFCGRISGKKLRVLLYGIVAAIGVRLVMYGVGIGSMLIPAAGGLLAGFAVYTMLAGMHLVPSWMQRCAPWAASAAVVLLVGVLLSGQWEPLGPQRGDLRNFIFVAVLVGMLLGFFRLFQMVYPRVLLWLLAHKAVFVTGVMLVLVLGGTIWFGFERVFAPAAAAGEKLGVDADITRSTTFWVRGGETFPGLGKEFMPPLDEGSFLYMPTTMTHASIGEAMDVLSTQDMAFRAIPEIDSVVGKIGRVESPLDPAPVSMIETVINYKPEYKTDRHGRRVKYRFNAKTQRFLRDGNGELIPDSSGRLYRQWRDHIKTPDDIWEEIVKAGEIPGTTSAPKLQPIATRIVMLQSGMRSPMGVKVRGPSLEAIEQAGLQIERLLKQVPSVEASAVVADRIVGKGYIEIVPDREAMGRYDVDMRDFHTVVEVAIGGKQITTTVEGRQRFPVRARYMRERRDQIEELENILIPGKRGQQIPLIHIADVLYVRGPQAIKSEDTFLTGNVLFDKKKGHAEVDVVEQCEQYLKDKIDSGELVLPAGVKYVFAGVYENELRSRKTLMLVLPLALLAIFVLLYLQFKSVFTTIVIFFGIFVAWAGGFILLWMYSQDWFLNFSAFEVNMRELFSIHPVNLSVAVWVGFLALFGIASDNGVIQSTYLDQTFRRRKPATTAAIREATVAAARRRVRPCLMTSATTILALIPVLTSVGRGSDVMVPMAIPSFGGMLVVLLSIFFVPVAYCWGKEFRLKHTSNAVGPEAEKAQDDRTGPSA